ncbi:TonB-dependent receptor plug domain-containing protein [Neptunomonas japonica]|uniref:TonB-dependent receptor plug domain-containing protein n=1 Tax=Neptunomonas japonica TaxID=417574 RepID=UPI000688160C|nr:TonB-dependent receptor [Neptunomonas japonica]
MKNFYICAIFSTLVCSQVVQANRESDSFELSLQELLEVEITSVSKQPQALSKAPAAIYVITNDDIRRSGATSIPQALRDVPGLHVAQLDSQKWAIGSRGFSGRYNNKLLVMMDGRTLYSPEFSGVYWEVQDTLMADIDRIEVIRGPGAAMWGANAVNGVINIITKHSADTQGGYAEIGAGDYEKGFASVRFGGKLDEGATIRGYVKGFKRDSLPFNDQDMLTLQRAMMNGVSSDNDWGDLQGGGRVDIALEGASSLTVSTDFYRSKLQQTVFTPTVDAPLYGKYYSDEFDANGWNLLAKFTEALSATSEYSIQAYYDHARRDDSLFGFTTDTADIDFQYQFKAGTSHNIIWGLGYRYINDDINVAPIITSEKSLDTSTDLWSAFMRDEIMLNDSLWLTLAARVEHNSYTGAEIQPNLRLLYKIDDVNTVWSSVAYSVRTPSRAENNLSINAVNILPNVSIAPPMPAVPYLTKIVVVGNGDYASEKLMTYEIGYRYTPFSVFSLDSSLFYNNYSDLRSVTTGITDLSTIPRGFITQHNSFSNNASGHSYGAEISAQWLVSNDFKMKLNYSFFEGDFSESLTQNTYAPKHIISLNADWSLNKHVGINATWRYTSDALALSPFTFTDKTIGSHQGVDVGVNWSPSSDITLSWFGKNLLGGSYVEYEAEQFHIPYRVEPSFYGKLSVSF